MTRNLSWQGFFLRWLFAAILVFATWNPDLYSYVGYLLGADDFFTDWPIKAGLGIVLVIGWVVYLRATLNALGTVGVMLVGALFATIIGGLAYYDVVAVGFNGTFIYCLLIFISLLLAVGMSWSHVSRRLSGQVDTDDVET